MTWIVVAGMGVLGVLMRYFVTQFWPPQSFPWSVLVVNVCGCAVAGFLLSHSTFNPRFSESFITAVAVGLLGGFTTFSTFAVDTVRLIAASPGLAAIYVVTTNLFCLGACYLGSRLGNTF